MMSYDKYKRGHQYLNEGHQRITYQKKKKTPKNLPYGLPKVISRYGWTMPLEFSC